MEGNGAVVALNPSEPPTWYPQNSYASDTLRKLRTGYHHGFNSDGNPYLVYFRHKCRSFDTISIVPRMKQVRRFVVAFFKCRNELSSLSGLMRLFVASEQFFSG